MVGEFYAKDLMSSPCITISANATVRDAAYLLQKYDVGSVVVTKDKKVVGIICERDFVNIVVRRVNASKVAVEEVMSKPVITCSPLTAIREVLSIMKRYKIKHVPVVEEGIPLGMISSFDLVKLTGIF